MKLFKLKIVLTGYSEEVNRTILVPTDIDFDKLHQNIQVDDPKARDFYIEECSKSNWSTRQLERQINTFSYQRLLMSRGNHDVVLDEVLVMGYPPIPFTKDAYMVALKGEVNAVVEDYSSIKHLVLSSTVRPGNSGGPVISQCGYLVGMVTQTTCNTNSTKDKQNKLNDDAETEKLMDKAPYYMALNGQELFESIKEIDGNIDIFFENYQ